MSRVPFLLRWSLFVLLLPLLLCFFVTAGSAPIAAAMTLSDVPPVCVPQPHHRCPRPPDPVVIGATLISTPDPIVPGQPVTYVLTITNYGSLDAGDVDFYFYPVNGETFSSVDLGTTGWKMLNDATHGGFHIDTNGPLHPQRPGKVTIQVASFPTSFYGVIATHKVTLGWFNGKLAATKDIYLHSIIVDNGPPAPPGSTPPTTPTQPSTPPTADEQVGFAAIEPFANTSDQTYFPQTQHSLSDDNGFKTYWETHGGLTMNGYPLSEEFEEVSPTDGQTYITQYFERAVFEYHPANADPYKVQLRLLGDLSGQRTPAAGSTDHDTTLFDYYPQTGHWLGGLFRDYWNARGGLAQFGYPISEPHVEGAKIVQWFERQRLEITGGVTTIDGVMLGLIGEEDAQRRGFPLTVS